MYLRDDPPHRAYTASSVWFVVDHGDRSSARRARRTQSGRASPSKGSVHIMHIDLGDQNLMCVAGFSANRGDAVDCQFGDSTSPRSEMMSKTKKRRPNKFDSFVTPPSRENSTFFMAYRVGSLLFPTPLENRLRPQPQPPHDHFFSLSPAIRHGPGA